MKILHVMPFFTKRRGGSVVVPYNLMKQQSVNGHLVTVIASNLERDENLLSDAVKNNINPVLFDIKYNIGLFLVTPEMKNWLNDNIDNYDIIHLHNFRSYQNIITAKIAWSKGKKYVLQPHGSYPKIEKFILKEIYDLIYGYKIFFKSSAIIAVSEYEKKQLKKHHDVHVIYNGVELKDNINEYDNIFHGFNLKDKKILLYIGRLSKLKGLFFLLKSIKLLKNDFNNFILFIIGPDEGIKDKLQIYINNNNLENYVKIMDYIENPKNAYCNADLTIYPSKYEIFGLVPFESLYYGTPVITTKNTGCGEILIRYGIGDAVDYGDIVGMKKMIIKVITKDNNIKLNKGKEFVIKELSWSNNFNKINKVYSYILEK